MHAVLVTLLISTICLAAANLSVDSALVQADPLPCCWVFMHYPRQATLPTTTKPAIGTVVVHLDLRCCLLIVIEAFKLVQISHAEVLIALCPTGLLLCADSPRHRLPP